MICLAIGQSQPGIFYLQKNYDFQKNTHFSTFYEKTTPLTQFYIPGNNPNLKMNLYRKTPFFEK